MKKTLLLVAFLLPVCCFAQLTISGRILNQADTRPVANASIFLSNTTVGGKTAADGTFTLYNIKPGKYQLVVSIIGFDGFSQVVTVDNSNITLRDITIFPKTTALKEVIVKYHEDPDRERYLTWFKDEFLGTSDRAKECKILNPELLSLNYDDASSTLTASSDDFLQIENAALGYKLKYLLKNFKLDNSDKSVKNVHYEGAVLFEQMDGTLSRIRRWQQKRQEVYDNSPMHFLRAALNNRIDEEGFRVQQYAIYANPERPSDELINAKIKLYKGLISPTGSQRDSLSYWVKKSKLPRIFQKLMPYPLTRQEIIKTTNQPGQYALDCDYDALYIAYSKSHRYHINDQVNYLYNANNTENTLVYFNQPQAFFNSNGIITNPYSLQSYGVWGRNRVAELLPIDYEPQQTSVSAAGNSFAQNISTKLDKYLTSHPAEKAYLQLDKPYYAAGDTIYFKAYVTKGEQHRLSDLSGILHVDLINTKNKFDQSLKLKLDSGLAWGDFALPDSLPAGNYRIRAYTNWMRNDGEAGFFDKIIPVGSLKKLRVPESLVKQPVQPNQKPDVQFFPESGALVAGINSKIAFKALGPNGLGIEVKGTIVDNDDNQVAVFTSSHLGMGYFYLNPAAGKNYTAKINYPNNQTDKINLPVAAAKGITLSVNNDTLQKASVTITASAACYQENRDKEYMLVIYSGGTATTVSCKLNSPVIKLDILKRKLHTGIATVALFSPQNEPLSERILFVQNYDALSLNLTGNSSYKKREKVNIKLSALNRAGELAEGHFSVAVIDESKVPEGGNDGGNILTNLLLTADLKGYVEQPGYYFADTGSVARRNLDVLLLTQGYRRFTWKRILDSADRRLAWQAENTFEIKGQVKSLFNKPVANGTVTLIPITKGPVFTSTTDDQGMFCFPNFSFTDTAHYVLSAVNANGKNATKVTYFGDGRNKPDVQPNPQQFVQQVTDTAMAAYLENDGAAQHEQLYTGNGIMLKQVMVHAKKVDNQYQTQSLAGAGNADQVIHADELEKVQGPIMTSLNGRLRGVIFDKGKPYLMLSLMNAMDKRNPPIPMLFIENGVEESDYSELQSLQASDVETVEVLRYASASMYGMSGEGGVLVITTKQYRGLNPKNITAVGVLPIAPMGFYIAKEFYAPKYTTAGLTSKQLDTRSTIYWQPELVTGKDGNASFEYYNADGSGAYKIVIEGIDNNGNLGRQVYSYKVE